ncbi:MAG: hypothetical protein H6659_00730 [Ardenticatenaceae bacterium]|nr:hypothetical protein [Anaerolineales bacterium]MCB8982329.1 hypothetical protein [Ardenticatenaceae bacterium]
MDSLRQVGRELINDADFNHLLLETLDWAREYIEEQESIDPHMLIFYGDPEGFQWTALTAPALTEDVVVGMAEIAAEVDAPLAAVFLVTEAWMTPKTNDPDLPPEDDPESIEVVLIAGITLDLRQNRTILKLERRDGRLHAGEVLSQPFIDDGIDQVETTVMFQFLRLYGAEALTRRGYDLPDD